MPKKHILIIALSGFSVAVVVALMIRPAPITSVETTVPSSHGPAGKYVEQPHNSPPVAKATPAPALPALIERQVLQDVADQYAALSQYPEYSVPMSPEQLQAYGNNRYIPTVLDLGSAGAVALAMNGYRHSEGDSIAVTAALADFPVLPSTLTATVTGVGSVVLHSENDGFYQGTFSTHGLDVGEHELILQVPVGNELIRQVARFTVEPKLLNLQDAGSPRVQDNNLSLPVNIDIQQPGYYSRSAALIIDGQPVGLLTTTGPQQSGNAQLTFRAHGTLLSAYKDAQRIELGQLTIRRLPARPGDRTDHQFHEHSISFDIPSLEGLTDMPYNNEAARMRLDFLQSLSQ